MLVNKHTELLSENESLKQIKNPLTPTIACKEWDEYKKSN